MSHFSLKDKKDFITRNNVFTLLLEEVLKNTNHGLKTGFKEVDNDITIQPSSLAFIAGRPSHGKTTMMLNMLRNMLEDEDKKENKNKKAFLFYSYEETRSDILIKIILSVADERLNQELINAKVEGVNLRQRAQDKPPIGGSLKEDTLDR